LLETDMVFYHQLPSRDEAVHERRVQRR
jgi:hypothetical protein